MRLRSSSWEAPRACEAAIERLATDRHHLARPARTLLRASHQHLADTEELTADEWAA